MQGNVRPLWHHCLQGIRFRNRGNGRSARASKRLSTCSATRVPLCGSSTVRSLGRTSACWRPGHSRFSANPPPLSSHTTLM